MSEPKFDEAAAKMKAEIYQAGRTLDALQGKGYTSTAETWIKAARWQHSQDKLAFDALKAEADKLANAIERTTAICSKRTWSEPDFREWDLIIQELPITLQAYRKFTGTE